MSGRDDHAASRRLARWLAEQTGLEGPLEVLGLDAPSGSGYANETLMFDAVESALVEQVHRCAQDLL